MQTDSQPTITAEQVAEYQRQQAAKERASDRAFGEALAAFLQQHGYQIWAQAVITPDGRTVAHWGFERVQRQ